MSQVFDEPKARVSSPSRAQMRANRRNAKRSTGPRTAEGKKRASLNAATHGIFCKDAVLPGERTSEYVAFRNLLLNAPGLRPQDWLELSLADQYVLARWRLRRLPGAEAAIHAEMTHVVCEDVYDDVATVFPDRSTADDDDDDVQQADLEDAIEQERARERRFRGRRRGGILGSYARLFMPRDVHAIAPGATLAAGFMEPDGGAFERLGRYQYRLEMSAHRALRELRQLRKDLGVDVTTLPECPFLEEVTDEDDEECDAREAGDVDTGASERETDMHAEACTPSGVGTDDDNALGVRTSVRMSGPSNANAQNEPNSKKTRAGDDASEGCEQASRRIGANLMRDDEREVRDRT